MSFVNSMLNLDRNAVISRQSRNSNETGWKRFEIKLSAEDTRSLFGTKHVQRNSETQIEANLLLTWIYFGIVKR